MRKTQQGIVLKAVHGPMHPARRHSQASVSLVGMVPGARPRTGKLARQVLLSEVRDMPVTGPDMLWMLWGGAP